MTGNPRPAEYVLLDACCLLNLYATRYMGQILTGLPYRFGASQKAASESLYVLQGGDGPQANEQEPVDLAPIQQAGLLDILDLETDSEFELFIDFAAYLDDGEAMTCALAASRGLSVATDDRRARTILATMAPSVPLFSTTQVIKAWADVRSITGPALQQILRDVAQRARFVPGRHDPLVHWWASVMGVSHT